MKYCTTKLLLFPLESEQYTQMGKESKFSLSQFVGLSSAPSRTSSPKGLVVKRRIRFPAAFF